MAWQSPSAMAGNGGGLGGAPNEGVPGHPHQQGTEYTLQGGKFQQFQWKIMLRLCENQLY